MTQAAMCKRTDSEIKPSQTLCLVVDGNSHAEQLLQDALPEHSFLISESLLPQVRTVAMMIASERMDFSQATPTHITEEADWFAARMLVLGVTSFHLDVTLLPMLTKANHRAEAFAKRHQLPFQAAKMRMSLHANRANNMLLIDLPHEHLPHDLGVVANSLALKQQVSLQSGFVHLMSEMHS